MGNSGAKLQTSHAEEGLRSTARATERLMRVPSSGRGALDRLLHDAANLIFPAGHGNGALGTDTALGLRPAVHHAMCAQRSLLQLCRSPCLAIHWCDLSRHRLQNERPTANCQELSLRITGPTSQTPLKLPVCPKPPASLALGQDRGEPVLVHIHPDQLEAVVLPDSVLPWLPPLVRV